MATIEATTSAAICPLMPLQVQKAKQLHDRPSAGTATASTAGVNM